MRKKIIAILMVVVMVSITACGKEETSNVCTCTCANCEMNRQQQTQDIDGKELLGLTDTPSVEASQTVNEPTTTQEIVSEASSEVDNATEEQVQPSEEQEQYVNVIASLTDGEKASRRQLQQDLVKQKESLYKAPASITKTQQINAIDQQIIANNAYDFSDKCFQFIGDSITEAVEGRIDSDGKRVSYTDYANGYLHFGNFISNGKAGRMFADYGGNDYFFGGSFTQEVYLFSNTIIIFLGVNDYLSALDNKRYGELDFDSYSTAGFCGVLRDITKFFRDNMPDTDIFFVTTYNLNIPVKATFSDMSPAPTYGDFMNKIKETAEKSGAHVIDLYNTGFLDCTDMETNKTYLADGIHPNDAGNKVLGEHIAAELVYYYSQK